MRSTGATALLARKAVVGVAGLAMLVSAALPSGAQTDGVPLPRANPFVTASAAIPGGAGNVGAPSAAVPQKTSARSGPVDRQTALAGINDYFNSFRTLEGEFVQVGPRGEQSEGVFVIQKPGKIRFRYKPPVMLDVISDGRTVAIEDKKAKTQDMYPLSKTPLRYLLANKIDLTSSSIVDEVREEQDLISLVIVEKSSLVQGKLTLIFDRQSYELRQWIVTDAQGLNTSVAIFNTAMGKKPDAKLFKIYRQRN